MQSARNCRGGRSWPTVAAAAFVLCRCVETHTDFGTRLGSCNVPVPEGFTCRGLTEWAPFLKGLQENAAKGFPPDAELFQSALGILSVFGDKPYPPEEFFKYLCGGEEAEWPLPDRFCLYGLVGALFVRGRHLMMSDERKFQKEAETDFQYATTVLANEGCMDFLDSSPWPVSILDLYININETEFMTYEQYARESPIPAPVVPLESIHWQPSIARTAEKRMPAQVLIAVVGTHATLSLEPVDMLQRFVSDVQLQPVFFGLEPRWCEILGICAQGTNALSRLFKDAEKDPHGYPWPAMVERITAIYAGDANLRGAGMLLCTEPLAGCLMLRQVASNSGVQLPLLGYLGVALLNSCPPEDTDIFWDAFSQLNLGGREPTTSSPAVLAVNNLILSEQIFYQSGVRVPYVRAHGLYTGMSYTPWRKTEILVWRAPLVMYATVQCAVGRFLQGMPEYPLNFKFVSEEENVPYRQASQYLATAIFPWDHALMTFYELYSAGIPLLMPDAEWMYRLVYSRGQLSVGERLYQSIRPGHTTPHAEFGDVQTEQSGPASPSNGMISTKTARNVAEDMLARAVNADDVESMRGYAKAALDLVRDMRYFLTVAEGKTGEEDSYSSMGVIRRTGKRKQAASDSEVSDSIAAATDPEAKATGEPWHPYTPFQMSPPDSNDWTRMRKEWWLRRGVRFDAMRYWYQFSDFARFPGLQYFSNLPDLLCKSQSLDIPAITVQMREHNEATLIHSASFWLDAFVQLLGSSTATPV